MRVVVDARSGNDFVPSAVPSHTVGRTGGASSLRASVRGRQRKVNAKWWSGTAIQSMGTGERADGTGPKGARGADGLRSPVIVRARALELTS
jgi:hypothetical protein